jgi:hypothetical protein
MLTQIMFRKHSRSFKARPFSLADYQVQLDLVKTVPEANEHFKQYLQRSFSFEGYLFLLEVEKLKSPQFSNEQKAGMIVQIYKNFICLKSPHEVNIDNRARDRVTAILMESKQLDHLDQLVVPLDVFYPVEAVVSRELRMDAFPRYIRSEDFMEFVSKKDETFLRQIAAVDAKWGAQELVFRPSDFQSTKLTDKDIIFMIRLNEDSPDWAPLRATKKNDIKEQDHYCYISKTSYHVGDAIEGLHLCKFTGYVPYSAEHLLEAIAKPETAKSFDHNMSVLQDVDYVPLDSNTPYPILYTYYEANLGIPFHKNRHCIQMCTVVYDTTRKCYMWVGKSTSVFNDKIEQVYHGTPQRKKMVPCDFVYGYTIYKISENKCRYVHSVYADVKVKMGLSMFKMVMKKREQGLHDGFISVCEQLRQANEAGHDKQREGPMKALDDNMARYLPTEESTKTWDL